jgi:predicted kinase
MATLIMMVGPSGSGKTTWIREFTKNNPGYVVVSPDEIRKELTGDVSNQTKNQDVWAEAKNKVRSLLSHGMNVILDSVMVTERDRNNFVDYLKNVKYVLKYKVMPVNPDDTEMLSSRVADDIKAGKERSNVPSYAIERQLSNFYKDLHKIDKKKLMK